ncbi:MAG: DUF192 domain-containing protein [Anaerolineae bacterium]|nr:DUF192 domain-containing protein [Anaerolineae bacterium]MDK1081532.1 DUF192 domain-containing protein [Anaerolineae bacterium]MDK1118303.1 DUF192 domain-containing protein [Anaerolineae bacterium]
MSRLIYVQNLNNLTRKPARVKYCESFGCRARGLTFRKQLATDDGLLLVQGNRDSRIETSIHMLFVPFELSVFWIDSTLVVVDKVIAKPWRLAYLSTKPARYILEIHPDRRDDYRVGDRVKFQDA